MKNRVNNIVAAFILVSVCLCLGACRRVSHNGQLDGNWQIIEIRDNNTGTIVQPKGEFMAVQLELVQFRGGESVITGVLSYSKSEDKIGIQFPDNTDIVTLRQYGVAENPALFTIVRLDSKRLCLHSEATDITFRRF